MGTCSPIIDDDRSTRENAMVQRIQLAFLALATLTASVAATDNEPFDLLFATTYHGNEITAGDGDVYFALVRDDAGWRLVSTPVRVARVEDPVFEEPGEMTGKEVRVEGAEPLFLVHGDLAPGPVETLVAERRSFYGSPSFDFELASGRTYRLTVDCPQAPEPTPEAVARREFPAAWGELCPVRLHHGASVQELAVLPVNRIHESGGALLWAGDLDRDGRLDVLIDLSYHYNVSVPTLFLSSAAGDGELVAPVAHLETMGC
jgi:hypothetical protein